MAKAHQMTPIKSPLKNLQSLEKKPWAYVSGGTITTLLKTYFCRESELTQEEKWVENESELLIFLIDALKNLPPKVSDPFLKDREKAILMTSPSHAFLLLPSQDKLRQGWQEDIFTYTWVRDEIFLPNQRFCSTFKLNPAEQSFLLQTFCEQLPPLLGHYLNQSLLSPEKTVFAHDWRNMILNALVHHTKASGVQKQTLTDGLDAFLYQALPLAPGKEWKVIVRRMLSDLMNEKIEKVLHLFPDVPSVLMTAKEIREAAKGCYLLAQNTVLFGFDLHSYVAAHARFVGNAQPSPLLFADSNWTNSFFGFIVNPGNLRLELWRLDRTMSQGVPMSAWKHWLNGTDRKTWSIFTRPYEYRMDVPSSALKF